MHVDGCSVQLGTDAVLMYDLELLMRDGHGLTVALRCAVLTNILNVERSLRFPDNAGMSC